MLSLVKRRIFGERKQAADAAPTGEAAALREKIAGYEKFVPPGHFYSPIPDQLDFSLREPSLYAAGQTFPGIDLRDAAQLDLLKTIAPLQRDLPFPDERASKHRFYYENDFYSYGDATIYACLLRHLRPKRVIEIGSGFSSALLLDMNLLFANNQIECTFIEPFPNRLKGLMRPADHAAVKIHQAMLQDVDPGIFAALGEGDFLFIDSTHVSKAGSDVNQLFFQVLPRLAKGVVVHIHDVFDPFEYPAPWVREGRAWNELYMLRSFLQFNSAFEIVYFNHYMANRHGAEVARVLPIAMRNPGGAIWLRKTI